MWAHILSQIPDEECIARCRRQGGARAMDLRDLFLRMLEHINGKREPGQGVSVKMEMKMKKKKYERVKALNSVSTVSPCVEIPVRVHNACIHI